MLVLDPLGCPYLGHSDDFAINFEEILSSFVLNVFWGYFVLINGRNWEVICLIPIFGGIFGQNFGI
jgi:hypothetical protein